MEIKLEEQIATAVRLTAENDGKTMARAYLHIIKNDLHEKPYSLLEDVFVEPHYRGLGVASTLVLKAIVESNSRGCYKIICTSRKSKPEVHDLYKKLGFKEHGVEFRMDL